MSLAGNDLNCMASHGGADVKRGIDHIYRCPTFPMIRFAPQVPAPSEGTGNRHSNPNDHVNQQTEAPPEKGPAADHESPEPEPDHGEGGEKKFHSDQNETKNDPVPPFARHLPTPNRQITAPRPPLKAKQGSNGYSARFVPRVMVDRRSGPRGRSFSRMARSPRGRTPWQGPQCGTFRKARAGRTP